MKAKNHTIISIDAEKAFHKIQHPFMIKISQESGIRRTIPKDKKGHIWQTHCQHHTQWVKITRIPLKIRNKTEVYAFTSLIQHSTWSPSHGNQIRRRNKRYPNWKVRSQTVLFSDDMILYIENTKTFHQEITRTHKWIQQSSRIQN